MIAPGIVPYELPLGNHINQHEAEKAEEHRVEFFKPGKMRLMPFRRSNRRSTSLSDTASILMRTTCSRCSSSNILSSTPTLRLTRPGFSLSARQLNV